MGLGLAGLKGFHELTAFRSQIEFLDADLMNWGT
jgi:hypothetical protein